MNKIIACGLIILSLTSCKKAIEKVAEDRIVLALTTGQWKVTSYVNNGMDVTSSFSEYKFQYYVNRNVDAIRNDLVEKTGQWDGDGSAMTVSANFVNVIEPLVLLNGTWHVDNSSWTFAELSQTNGTQTKTMRLDKK